jgi:hypothetical protein
VSSAPARPYPDGPLPAPTYRPKQIPALDKFRKWIPILGSVPLLLAGLRGWTERYFQGRPLFTDSELLAWVALLVLDGFAFLLFRRIVRHVEEFSLTEESLIVKYRGPQFEKSYSIPWSAVRVERWLPKDRKTGRPLSGGSLPLGYGLTFPNPTASRLTFLPRDLVPIDGALLPAIGNRAAFVDDPAS